MDVVEQSRMGDSNLNTSIRNDPPPIPHITANMIPLNVVLERISLDAYNKIREYFKFMESGTQSDVEKKRQLLELLVSIRENFLRLYVISKWSKNHKEISKLIDIFAWLREQNQAIINTIMSFGAIKSSLIGAKLPEPDLMTSLEVLLTGRPNLPTYNYLDEENNLSPEFVLKILKNLNVELSIKMSRQEIIPNHFKNYSIKDGCIYFNIPGEYSCSLSLLSDNHFHLIDFNLGFTLDSNSIITSKKPSLNLIDKKSIFAIEKLGNQILSESDDLQKLDNLLFNFAVTRKIHLLHKQLIELRMGIWRGHLTHTYNPELSSMVITYWVQRKYAKPSTIHIEKSKNDNGDIDISIKWFMDGELVEDHDFYLINSFITDVNDPNYGKIDLIGTIKHIIKYHIKMIVLKLKENLIKSVEDTDKMIILSEKCDKLTFKISQFKQIIFNIDLLSGSCFFENPTNTMNRSSYKINVGNSLDYIEILKLKMSIQESEFSSMMNATSWINLKSVRLTNDEIPKLNINYSNLKDKSLASVLSTFELYKRKDWPIGWTLIVGHFGFQSNVQIWCAKIESVEGQWIIKWFTKIYLDEITESFEDIASTNKLESSDSTDVDDISSDLSIKVENRVHKRKDTEIENINSKKLSYDDLLKLIKISSSKLISNLIVKELKDQGCQLKVLNSNDILVKQFLTSNFYIDDIDNATSDNAILLIKNKSLFHIQNAKDSLVLLISIKNNELNAKIFGKLLDDNSFENVPDIKYKDDNLTAIEYNSKTKIFKVESDVDLSNQFQSSMNNVIDSRNSLFFSGFDIVNPDNLILSNILSFLKKFARSLNLIKLVSNNPSLKIIKVLSDGIQFKYGADDSETITLKISPNTDKNIIIEFPENNLQIQYSDYLNKVISNGDITNLTIKELVLYLTLTLEYCKKIQDFSNRVGNMMELFKKQNELVDLESNPELFKYTPNFGYIPYVFNLDNLRISYFKMIKIETISTGTKKKANKIIDDVFRFQLRIELRHKLNKVSKLYSKYFISLGDIRTNTTDVITSTETINSICGTNPTSLHKLTQNVTSLLTKYFSGEDFPQDLLKQETDAATGKTASKGSVVFLQDGICCDFDSISYVLEDLHTRLYSLMSTP